MRHLIVSSAALLLVSSSVCAGDPRPEELLRALKDNDPLVRIQAASALNRIDKQHLKDSLPVLYLAHNHEDDRVRQAADKALAEIGAGVRQAMPWAVEQLKRGDNPTTQKVIESFQSFGLQAVPPLVEALAIDTTPPSSSYRSQAEYQALQAQQALAQARGRLRLVASQALAKVGPPVVPTLIILTDDRNALVRMGVADALAHLGADGKEAVPALTSLLKDRDAGVRQSAINALGQISKSVPSVIPVLVSALDHKDAAVRRTAVNALQPGGPPLVPGGSGIMRTTSPRTIVRTYPLQPGSANAAAAPPPVTIPVELKAAVPALKAVLSDPDGGIRVKAAEVLTLIDADPKEAYVTLVEELAGRDVGNRTQAGQVLERLGPRVKSQAPALTRLLKAPDAPIRLSAARILGTIGRDESAVALPVVLELLKERAAGSRRDALTALKQFKADPNSLLPTLTTALADDDQHVRAQAAELLIDLGHTKQALPVLLAVAFPDRNDQQRDASAVSFANQVITRLNTNQPRDLVPGLVEALKSDNVDSRRQVLTLLMRLGPNAREATPALLALIKDKDPSIRNLAVTTLNQIGSVPKEAVPGLIAALKEADPSLRFQLVQLLRSLGPEAKEAVPVLIEQAKSEDPTQRIQAVQLLGQIGPDAKAALPVLTELAKSPDRNLVVAVVSTLGELGPDGVPALLSVLDHPDRTLRHNALNALTNIARSGGQITPAIPALMEALKDPDENLRRSASYALSHVGPESVPALSKAMDHADPQVRRLVTATLARLGRQVRPALPALKEALKDPDPGVRCHAALILWTLERRPEAALPAFLDGLKEQDPQVRRAAISGLYRIEPKNQQVIAALKECLNDSDNDLRLRAAEALAGIPGEAKPAVPVLISFLDDKEQQHRWRAAYALSRAGNDLKESVPTLLEIMKTSTDGSMSSYLAMGLGQAGPDAIPLLERAVLGSDVNLRSHAARALGHVGPAAEPVLLKLARHEDERVRAAAVSSLDSLIGESDAALKALLGAFQDPSLAVRQAAVTVVLLRGADAEAVLPALLKLLKQDSGAMPPEHQNLLEALSRMGRSAQAAVPALTEMLPRLQGQERMRCASALLRIDPSNREGFETLAAALKETNPFSVRQAASTLGAAEGAIAKEAMPLLVAALDHPDRETRTAVAVALTRLGAEPKIVMPVLLTSHDRRMRMVIDSHTVAEALSQLGPEAKEAVPMLIEWLQQTPPRFTQKIKIVEALGRIGPNASAATPHLIRLLYDAADPSICGPAALALWRIDPQKQAVALAALADALSDPTPTARERAAEALGEMGPHAKEATPLLETALLDSAASVRVAAASALWKITGQSEAPVKVLLAALDDKAASTKDVLAALGDMGPAAKAAIPKLKELQTHRKASVRRQAAEALPKIDK